MTKPRSSPGPNQYQFMGLPRGSRDLLPPTSRQRRAVIATLLDTFEQWGYEPVTTPLVEYYDVVSRGLTEADRRMCVRFIEAGSGAVVALRSDLTPQIARIVAEHTQGALAGRRPVRLCYAADVIRQPADEREQTEYHQVGVELIGEGSPHADAEALALCHAALRRVGLSKFRLDLSHRQVASAMLEPLGLQPDDQTEVARMLARKNRGAVEGFLQARGVGAELRDTVGSMCDLYGPPREVMPKASNVLASIGAQQGLQRLQEVLEILAALEPQAHACVDVDLGETRGFDYYTGLRVRAWAPGVAAPLARGGRYDTLLARYGAAAPATGFAFDLDALESALRAVGSHDGIGEQAARLVAVLPTAGAPAKLHAARLAATHRAAGGRAFVATAMTVDEAITLAEASGATWVSHVDEDARDGLAVTHRKRHRNANEHRWVVDDGPGPQPDDEQE